MNARKYDESLARLPLHNGRRLVRKSRDHLSPSRKLWTILPVHIERNIIRPSDFDRFNMDNPALIDVEIERNSSGQIQPVVNRRSAEERPCTNSQIMRAIQSHRPANRGRCAGRETLTDLDRIPSWDDDQLVARHFSFAQVVELG